MTLRAMMFLALAAMASLPAYAGEQDAGVAAGLRDIGPSHGATIHRGKVSATAVGAVIGVGLTTLFVIGCDDCDWDAGKLATTSALIVLPCVGIGLVVDHVLPDERWRGLNVPDRDRRRVGISAVIRY